MSTRIIFLHTLNVMLKNNLIKDLLLLIINNEACTFDMETLFR
ncbi:MAG: hypothetical protein ACTS8R_08975 [Arsenophonus sp. NC-QC1-MAG3]